MRRKAADRPAVTAAIRRSSRGTKGLARDLGKLIEAARGGVARAANAALTALYWEIGRRIQAEVLRHARAAYGAEIVGAPGRQLEAEFGRGFGEKNLRRQFAQAFPDEKIVATLQRQLSWSHFKLLLPLEDALARESYAAMCAGEGWSTRLLQQKILDLDRSGIHVAEYLTELPPRAVLKRRFHEALVAARARLAHRAELQVSEGKTS